MVEVDLSQPPFTFLDEEGRERVRSGVDLAYFDRDEIILDAGQPGEFVFIIHKGEVAELDTTLPGARERIGHYTAGDLFGAISILNGKSRYRFRAEQESLCYLLPKALFLRLCDDYPPFAEFFRQTLSHKARLLTEQRAEGGVTMAGFMLAKVSECMREPLIVGVETTIAEAVSTIHEGHADSLLVGSASGHGMVTKTDLLNALVLQDRDKHSPVVETAHFELITVRPDQYLFEALVIMTRFKVERVVVLEQRQALRGGGADRCPQLLLQPQLRGEPAGRAGRQPGGAVPGQSSHTGAGQGADGPGRQAALRHGPAGGPQRPHHVQGVGLSDR
jgi:CBS domain-containing protein